VTTWAGKVLAKRPPITQRFRADGRRALAVGLWATLTAAVLALPISASIAIPIGIAIVFAFLAQPTEGLLLILVARVLVDLLWWIPAEIAGLNLMELYSGGVAALAMILVGTELRRTLPHPFVPWMIPFLCVLSIAAVRSGDPRASAEIAARFLSPPLLLFLVSQRFTRVQTRWMLLALPLAGIVPIVLGYLALASGQMNEITLSGYARLRGAYANIHNHAHAMALFAVLGVYWTRHAGTKDSPNLFRSALWMAAWATYVAAAVGLLYLTYVRTALLGLAAFAIAFLLLERRFKLAVGIITALALVIAGNAALQDRFSDVVEIFAADPAEHDTGKLGSGRIELWTDAFTGWLRQSPLDLVAGMGLDRQHELNHQALDSHNDYLSLLFQVGPVGVAAYVGFQALLVHHAWKLRRQSAEVATFANLMIALTAMVTLDNLLSNSYVSRIHVAWLYWALAGGIFAETRRDDPSVSRSARAAAPRSPG
jgi:hypothetical protein